MATLDSRTRQQAWAAAVILVLASGCVSRGGRAPVTRPTPDAPVGPRSVEAILGTARSLLGSGYRYGGESRREGFDCSGFSRHVFERHGIVLPRTTLEQARIGWWVPLDSLAIGDLVFFSDENKPAHHVGIVSSRPGEALTMVHASSSRGIVETDVLESGYWLDRLRFGRRVLPR